MNPGSFDTLHFESLFESDNKYGIPLLAAGKIVTTEFLPFNVITKCNNNGIHCFVYDYYLERIWKRPEVYVKYLQKSKVFFTPDFSLYTDIPLALQIFNIYRNRWIGAYMQNEGVNVIPTISWALENSYDFAFLGIKIGSPVAISTVGIRKYQIDIFKAGIEQMKKIISPSLVYVYGDKEKDYLSSFFSCIFIDTFSKTIKNRCYEKNEA